MILAETHHGQPGESRLWLLPIEVHGSSQTQSWFPTWQVLCLWWLPLSCTLVGLVSLRLLGHKSVIHPWTTVLGLIFHKYFISMSKSANCCRLMRMSFCHSSAGYSECVIALQACTKRVMASLCRDSMKKNLKHAEIFLSETFPLLGLL